AHATWKVLPHQPIEKLEANLWRVEGSLEGMPLLRVMTLARLDDGRVVVHNAMALGEAEMKEIEAWGEPAFLLVPNAFHRLDAPAFKARYPRIKVLCPRGARAKVEEVVAVDGGYDDLPAGDAVRLEHLDGTREGEGVMAVRSGDATTIVLNDAVFNMPHGRGATGLVFRYVTQSSGGPRVSRVARWFLVKDRAAFARHLQRLADTPGLRRVIVSHHRTIDERPAETLRAVAATL
ncbi:MAG TPA: hypothetical protein VFS00_19565, partial [Polyangiaceae bacterium]|nr:hypothetical protein [Polyangiaceae bacterium]